MHSKYRITIILASLYTGVLLVDYFNPLKTGDCYDILPTNERENISLILISSFASELLENIEGVFPSIFWTIAKTLQELPE